MTTEEDFQRQLDLHPDDHHTRLVLADFLDERGDPRGPGYRALGLLQLRGRAIGTIVYWYDLEVFGVEGFADQTSNLPQDWFTKLHVGAALFTNYKSRRASDDAAALAFSRLPAERQHELLNLQPTGK